MSLRRSRPHRRAALAIQVGERELWGAQFAPAAAPDEAPRALAWARFPRGADLAQDLRRLRGELGPAASADVVLVDEAAAALCIELPPGAEDEPARLLGIARWELEPYLDGEGEPVCGAAEAAGGPGAPRYVAGLARGRRDELATACAAAGFRPRAVLPAAGACAALLADDGVALEVGARRAQFVRVAAGAVVELRQESCAPEAVADRCLELLAEPASAVRVGPAPEDVRAVLSALGVRELARGELPASLLGAGCYALGLPGAARLPALPARPPRPPLLSGWRARTVCAVLLLGALGGLCELGGRAWRAKAEADIARLEEQRRRLEEAQAAGRAAAARRDALAAELSEAEHRLGRHEAAAERQRWLPALLAALSASLPAEVAIDALHDDGDGTLRVEGFSLSELAAKELLRNLSNRLLEHGFVPAEPTLRRRRGRLGAWGYGFVFRFGREERAG